ncbi:MAG: response regulator transcription factor [Chloroflexi bacterium]|nr:response regulator transcription factor [Chloroflexota bacterium]
MTRLLLLDDERVNGELLKLSLEMDGYTVTLCPGLSHARAAITADVSAFIIDHYLGQGETGLELLQEIRQGQTAAAPDSFVIVTSGDDRREEEALASGANMFLLKPFSPLKLSESIHQHLASSS